MRKQKILIPLILITSLFSSNIVYSITSSELGSNNDIDKYLFSVVPSTIQNTIINSSLSIIYPLSTIPVIVEKEEQFIIQFKANNFDDIYAYISTAYEPVVDEYWLTLGDPWLTDDIWNINATIPSIVTSELYNITILVDKNSLLFSATQPRAVSVVEEFSDNFSFVHIADFHVGDPRGFAESIRETIGYKSIKRCIDEVNLLQPDFVIISGDLVFGQLYWKEYSREYPKCYEFIQQFDVPTYLCPGNHDGYWRPFEDGLEFWEKYFGPHYYSFDYDDYHFIAINSYDWSPIFRFSLSFFVVSWGGSIRDEQLQWIENDLKSIDSELTFMFIHHNPLWDTKNQGFLRQEYKNRENLMSLINQYGVDMVLAGHVHYDNVTIVNDTIFVTTTTPESSISRKDGYWGYRLVRIENGAITSYNYKEPKYSIPSYKLKATYKSNDKAIVENQLEIDIIAHLKFVLPKENYVVNYGEIVLQREDETSVELYVETMVTQNSTLTVKISKKSTDNLQ